MTPHRVRRQAATAGKYPVTEGPQASVTLAFLRDCDFPSEGIPIIQVKTQNPSASHKQNQSGQESLPLLVGVMHLYLIPHLGKICNSQVHLC